MTVPSSRTVRNAFVSLTLGLTLFTLAEAAVGAGPARAPEGLSTCGTRDEPCTLEPVAVVARPAAEGLIACGSAANPCVLPAVAAQAQRGAGRLASSERPARMMLRAGS